MAFGIGSFSATLGIDTSGWSGGLTAANAVTSVFGQTVTNFMTNPILGAVGAMTSMGRAVISTAAENLRYAETISRLAAETGASTDTVQTLREVLDDAGVSVDQAQAGLAKFADMLGTARRDGGPAAEAIRALGLNLERVGDGDAAIRATLEALAGIESASKRADLAAALFGRTAGPALATALRQSQGSMQSLVDEYRQYGLVLDAGVIEKTAKVDALMDSLSNSAQGIVRSGMAAFLTGAAEGFGEMQGPAETVQQILKQIVPAAEGAGRAFGDLAKYLKDLAGSDTVQGLREVNRMLDRIEQAGEKAGIGNPLTFLWRARSEGVRLAMQPIVDVSYGLSPWDRSLPQNAGIVNGRRPVK